MSKPTEKQLKYWESKKGKSTWNKGLSNLPKWSKETREKMKKRPASMKGKKHSQESKDKRRKSSQF